MGLIQRTVKTGFGFLLSLLMANLVCSAAFAVETVLSTASRQNPLDGNGGAARAIAMGAAFVGVSDDVSALLWNPAGLSSLENPEISMHHTSWLSQTFQEVLLLGIPVRGLGSLGLSANYVGYGSFEGRDALGFPLPSYSADQMGLGLGWGIKILGDFSVGAGLHGTQQNLGGISYFLPTADAGLLLKTKSGWGVGMSIQNLGPALSGNILASAFRLGVSRQWKGKDGLSLLAALSGDVEPQGGNSLQGGVEAAYHSLLFARVGYNLQLQNTGYDGIQGLTAGVGIVLEQFHLDYAFVPYGELGATHLVSLGYSFGETLARPAASALPAVLPSIPLPLPVSSTQPSATTSLPAGISLAQGMPNASGALLQASTPLPVSSAQPASDLSLPAGPPSAQTMPEAPGGAGASQTERTITMEFEVPAENDVAQAKALAQAGQWNTSIVAFREIIRKNPGNAAAWRELGNIYYHLNHVDYAVTCFERALKLQPDDKALADWLERYRGR